MSVVAGVRGLASHLGALGAAMAVAFGTCVFAVLTAVAWTTTLPDGARADLAASPAAALDVAWQPGSGQNSIGQNSVGVGQGAGVVDAAVRASGGAGLFTTAVISRSGYLTLSTPAPAGQTPQISAVASPALRGVSTLIDGNWPTAPIRGTAIPAALPRATATALHARVGETLSLRDAASNAPVSVVVTGIFRRVPSAAAFWTWDSYGSSGMLTLGSFTTYDPMIVDPAVLGSGPLRVGSAIAVVQPAASRTGSAGAAGLSRMSAIVSAFEQTLNADPARSYHVTGDLPGVLSGLAARVAAAQAQLLAAALLLGVVGVAAMVAVGGLLAGGGTAQVALRRARGASRVHLVSVYGLEFCLLALAAAAGAPVGQWLAHGASGASWLLAGCVAVLAIGAAALRLGLPPRPGEALVALGRQQPLAAGFRAGVDLALAALAGVAFWQAASAPSVAVGTDAVPSVNPVAVAAPALAVAAGAALTGRLVPPAARLAERLAARARRLPMLFACWQISRTPVAYILPGLVTLAAVAGATYAVADHDSRARSLGDQAAYTVGADAAVRAVQPLTPGQTGVLADGRGVLAATPVVRVSDGSTTLLALDAKSAGQTVLLRPDLVDRPPGAVWDALQQHPSMGLALTGAPRVLSFQAALRTLAGAGQRLTVKVDATVQDATGLLYSVDLGSLPDDGLAHPLSGALTTHTAAYPISLLQIGLSYTLPAVALPAVMQYMDLTLTGIRGLDTWSATNESPKVLKAPELSSGVCGPKAFSVKPPMPGRVQQDHSDVSVLHTSFLTGYGMNWTVWNADPTDTEPRYVCQPYPAEGRIALTARAPGSFALPAVATRAYLDATGASLGSIVQASVDGVAVPMRIAAVATGFPTIGDDAPEALVVDLPALAHVSFAADTGASLPPVDEWWLHTRDGAFSDLPPDATVTTTAATIAQLAGDPLSSTPQRTLDLGIADLAALAMLGLAAALGGAGRGRAGHAATLGLLGAQRRQLAAIRGALHAAVVVPCAVLGLGLGAAVAWVLIPRQLLAPDGSSPLPPVLVTARALLWLPAPLLAIALALLAAADQPLRGRRRRTRPDMDLT